jgi:hypothetical protein
MRIGGSATKPSIIMKRSMSLRALLARSPSMDLSSSKIVANNKDARDERKGIEECLKCAAIPKSFISVQLICLHQRRAEGRFRMLFLIAASIGVCAGMMRSAFSVAFIAFLILATFGFASAFSAGPPSYLGLLLAVLGYNTGLASFVMGLLAIHRLRPA